MHKLSFLFNWYKKSHPENLKLVDQPDAIELKSPVPQLFITKEFQPIHLPNYDVFIGGDPVFSGDIRRIIEENNFDPARILKSVKGHYYLFLVNAKQRRIIVSASLFNMFPIFYYEDEQNFIAASDIRFVSEVLERKMTINKKFILEMMIFNYPLFDDTFYRDVRLLNANHFIEVTNNRVRFNKYFDIAELYVSDPVPYKKKADFLADLFISRYKEYIPKVSHYISFTGGFDGRTLTACGHFYGADFKTFSFGTKLNDDVTVPLQNAKEAEINFQPIYLDTEEYIEKAFLETGKGLIALTSGYSNFLYVHSLYAAKLLSHEAEYVLSGFFGSELFRALHLTGSFCSNELVLFFKNSDNDQWIKNIRNTFKLKCLKTEKFKNEIDEIIEDLIQYKKIRTTCGSLNQFFYKYVMTEIFRKVFGSQIFGQFNHIKVRTPFLDYDFIQELFKTDLAGVNNSFFVQNPLKRLKGQYFYAKVINKTFPELAGIKTQKGYTPKDLLTVTGKFKIVRPFIMKRMKRRIAKPYLDNLSIISGLKYNQSYFSKKLIDSNLFDIQELFNVFNGLDNRPETQRDLLALALSMSLIK